MNWFRQISFSEENLKCSSNIGKLFISINLYKLIIIIYFNPTKCNLCYIMLHVQRSSKIDLNPHPRSNAANNHLNHCAVEFLHVGKLFTVA